MTRVIYRIIHHSKTNTVQFYVCSIFLKKSTDLNNIIGITIFYKDDFHLLHFP